MLRTLAIVEVSTTGTAISPKHPSRRRLGGKSLVEWVVRRVTESQSIDGVIVAADSHEPDVAELAPPDVPVYIGEPDDPLKRFASALDRFPAEAVVRVRGDAPFVDPTLVDRLVRTATTCPECDYVGFCARDGRPAVLSPVGVFAEWIRAAALRKADRRASDPRDRRQVTRYIYSHPEAFQLRLIPAPERLLREDVRLTIESEEDWEHIQDIYEALGAESLDWQHVVELLDHQPRLRQRMATLNREGLVSCKLTNN